LQGNDITKLHAVLTVASVFCTHDPMNMYLKDTTQSTYFKEARHLLYLKSAQQHSAVEKTRQDR
jgi:hypothetical protein